jgi:hypothetical protein
LAVLVALLNRADADAGEQQPRTDECAERCEGWIRDAVVSWTTRFNRSGTTTKMTRLSTTNNAPFTTRHVGSTGHEILSADGYVVAWTVDEYWAVVVVEAMNRADADGLSEQPDPLIIRY